jgi:hypothetical protein
VQVELVVQRGRAVLLVLGTYVPKQPLGHLHAGWTERK